MTSKCLDYLMPCFHDCCRFERRFVNQGAYERRDIYTSLDMAWDLLRIFPVQMLRRIPEKILQEYYHRTGNYEHKENKPHSIRS